MTGSKMLNIQSGFNPDKAMYLSSYCYKFVVTFNRYYMPL